MASDAPPRPAEPVPARPAEPVPARPAATVLLLRDGAAGPEVFMVLRHAQTAFAAGALVFPGGSVDPGDAAIAAGLPDADGLGAVRVAGVRELFEESGVLLAARTDGSAPDPHRLAELRGALDSGAMEFAAVLAAEALVPAVGALVRTAHWVTPVDLKKRFDTHFFLAAAPDGHAAAHDGRETVASCWITPSAALAAGEAGERVLLFPTRLTLGRLRDAADVAAALAAARAAPIVTVMPRVERAADGSLTLHIPAEAGYGGSVFPGGLRAM